MTPEEREALKQSVKDELDAEDAAEEAKMEWEQERGKTLDTHGDVMGTVIWIVKAVVLFWVLSTLLTGIVWLLILFFA